MISLEKSVPQSCGNGGYAPLRNAVLGCDPYESPFSTASGKGSAVVSGAGLVMPACGVPRHGLVDDDDWLGCSVDEDQAGGVASGVVGGAARGAI